MLLGLSLDIIKEILILSYQSYSQIACVCKGLNEAVTLIKPQLHFQMVLDELPKMQHEEIIITNYNNVIYKQLLVGRSLTKLTYVELDYMSTFMRTSTTYIYKTKNRLWRKWAYLHSNRAHINYLAGPPPSINNFESLYIQIPYINERNLVRTIPNYRSVNIWF